MYIFFFEINQRCPAFSSFFSHLSFLIQFQASLFFNTLAHLVPRDFAFVDVKTVKQRCYHDYGRKKLDNGSWKRSLRDRITLRRRSVALLYTYFYGLHILCVFGLPKQPFAVKNSFDSRFFSNFYKKEHWGLPLLFSIQKVLVDKIFLWIESESLTPWVILTRTHFSGKKYLLTVPTLGQIDPVCQ